MKSNKFLAIFALLFACTATAKSSLENQLLGSWCATSSDEFHQEFVLEINAHENENRREFRAYLHQRPADFGTWHLEKKRLTVTTHLGIFHYQIMQLSHKKLSLRTTEGSIARYKRCN
jgi:hypothetical protein